MIGRRKIIPPYYDSEFDDGLSSEKLIESKPSIDKFEKANDDDDSTAAAAVASENVKSKNGWEWIRQDNDGPTVANKHENNGRYYPGEKKYNNRNQQQQTNNNNNNRRSFNLPLNSASATFINSLLFFTCLIFASFDFLLS